MEPTTGTPTSSGQGFDQAKFNAILQAHNYTPPTQSGGSAPTANWRQLAKTQQPQVNPFVEAAKGAISGFSGEINKASDVLSQQAAKAPVEHTSIGDVSAPTLGQEAATAADVAGHATAAPFAAIGGAVTGAFPQVSDAISRLSQGIADTIHANPQAAAMLSKVQELANQHPELAQFLGGISSTAMNIGTSGLVGAGTDVATGVAKGAVGKATEAVSTASEAAKGIPEKLKTAALEQEKAAWEKPTTVAKPAYGKATDIYGSASSDHIPETLVNNGIRISDNIDTVNGRQVYSTTDSAEKIREDAGKMSSDILRPSLEKADFSTPKTPVADVFAKAENNIRSNKFLTPGTKEDLVASLQKEMVAAQKAHPDGLGLVDLHDNKILYDANAKYSPIGDIATNNKATMNKAIADANRSTLEANAPADIPVKEFNAELQKQYQAANYLDALHGKPVPKGTASAIAKLGAKIVGAGVGSHFGGGILGGVGGYHLGGMVESMIENAPSSVRSALLKNLETSNPEVYAKVQDYLKTNNLLALPSPSATITPAPSEAEQMTGRAKTILGK